MTTVKLTTTFCLFLLVNQLDFVTNCLSSFLMPFITLCFCWQLASYLSQHVILGKLLPKVDPKNKAVFITGCDSGFGRMTALQLNKLGFSVIAAVLTPESEEPLVHESQFPEKMKVFPLDVTKHEDVIRTRDLVKSYLTSNKLSLHAVINNAGIAFGGLIEWAPDGSVDDFSKMLEVNTFGVIRVSRAFLPLLRTSPGSRLINLTSIMSRTSLPGLAVYTISKAAAAKFTECLQMELTQKGVHCISIEPWFYKTPLLDVDRILDTINAAWNSASPEVRSAYGGEKELARMHHMSSFTVAHEGNVIQFPEHVVDALVSAVQSAEPNPVYRVITPGLGLGFWIINDLLPWDLMIPIRRLTHYVPFFYDVKKKGQKEAKEAIDTENEKNKEKDS